jgi:hypothetical protein
LGQGEGGSGQQERSENPGEPGDGKCLAFFRGWAFHQKKLMIQACHVKTVEDFPNGAMRAASNVAVTSPS